MNSKNLLSLGRVIKAHGIKGDILVTIYNESIKFTNDLKAIWLGEKPSHTSSWEIEKFNRSGEKVFLKLRNVETPEEANFLKGLNVYITDDLVEAKSIFDAIGFTVINDINQETVGDLVNIEQGVMQDLMVIDMAGEEKMIPVVSEFIKDIDWDDRKVFVEIIEGLL